MSDLIGPEEARAIQAAMSEMRTEPPPRDTGAMGCLLSILAVMGLIALPIVAARVGLMGTPLILIKVALGGAVVVGLVWNVFGGAFSRGAVSGRVEQAITELIAIHPDGPSDRMLALATRIICDAYVSTGPATTTTFESTEVAERLGPALPYVIGVERWLVEHEGVYSVFT